MTTIASRKSRQGFSLVEVVIAVAVAGLFLIGITGLLGTGLSVSQASSRESKASGIMSQVIDDLHSTPSGAKSPYYQISVLAAGPAASSTMTGNAPQSFYVTDAGLVGEPGGNPSANYRVTVGFLPPATPPAPQVFQARIMVSWPAQTAVGADGWPTSVGGSVENVISINPAQIFPTPVTTQ